MNWIDPRNWIIVGLAVAVMAAMGWGAAQSQRLAAAQAKAAGLETAIAVQRAEAAETLAEETGRTLEAERRAHEQRAQQEKTDANNTATITRLESSLRARSRAAGGPGLRDPNAAACGVGGGGPTTQTAADPDRGAGDGAEAGGLVSEPMERLLLETIAEADRINVAYASCRADAVNSRKQLERMPP